MTVVVLVGYFTVLIIVITAIINLVISLSFCYQCYDYFNRFLGLKFHLPSLSEVYQRINQPVNLFKLSSFQSFTTDYIASFQDRINYLFGDFLAKAFAAKFIVVKFAKQLFLVTTVDLFRLVVPKYFVTQQLIRLVLNPKQVD